MSRPVKVGWSPKGRKPPRRRGEFTPFKSEREALQRAEKAWACKACGAQRSDKPETNLCTVCNGRRGFWKLDSLIEAERFAQLWILQHQGKIADLQCQVTIPLRVNGILVTRYRVDFRYRDLVHGNKQVFEDVKPPGFMTDLAKVKIKLFNAVHAPLGLAVKINEMEG